MRNRDSADAHVLLITIAHFRIAAELLVRRRRVGWAMRMRSKRVMLLAAAVAGVCPSALGGVIGAGEYHSIGLKSDDTVIGWGWNGEGQTTIPGGLSDVTQIAAGGYHNLALKSDGTVVAWGYNNDGQTTVP